LLRHKYDYYQIVTYMIMGKTLIKGLCLAILIAVSTTCSGPENPVEKPQSIALSADKMQLKSDGIEFATFSVSADGKPIDSGYVITNIEDNTVLSTNTFSTNIPGVHSFFASYEGLRSDNIQINAEEIILVLSADTNLIKSNGTGQVTFTVMADDRNITPEAEIYYMEGETEVKLESNVFTTEVEGVYDFYCKYNGIVSNKITVNAIPCVLTLKADLASINANGYDTVTFTVFGDDEDITDKAEIYLKEGENATKLESNTFTATVSGNYEFFAKYNGHASEVITIDAVTSKLNIYVSPGLVYVGQTVTVLAIYNDTYDVSSEITLNIKNGDEEENIQGNSYTVTSFGTRLISATYKGTVSDTFELRVIPSKVEILSDKTEIIWSGTDTASFTVIVDGKTVNDAEIYQVGDIQDIRIDNQWFTSKVNGVYTFYALYSGVKSNIIHINVKPAQFLKRSVIMEAVATWCGFSPQMIMAFHEVRAEYSDYIDIVSMHCHNSLLESTEIRGEELLSFMGREGTPFGFIDLFQQLTRTKDAIVRAYSDMKMIYPVTSSVAISSHTTTDSIIVKLKIKASQTNEYSVGAIIVEDNIVKRQRFYPDFQTHDNAYYDETFVHYGVATYQIPGTEFHTGVPLGVISEGNEASYSFSIPLDKTVTPDRTVNLNNCRVIAYVMKRNAAWENRLVVNNSASCPLNGSVDYQYEK